MGFQLNTCAPVAKVTVEHMTWDKQCFLQGGKELRSVTAAAVGAAPIELFPDSKVLVARKSTSTLEKGLQALRVRPRGLCQDLWPGGELLVLLWVHTEAQKMWITRQRLVPPAATMAPTTLRS